MNTSVLIDLGSHTVKIGTVQTEESSEDLFHVSRMSAASLLNNTSTFSGANNDAG